MALPHDLLAQARALATNEPRRPRQASLRRAVSTAYYALFHLLAAEAAARFLTGVDRQPLRAQLQRAFAHTTMAEACKEIRKPNGGRLAASIPGSPVQSELASLAGAFLDLQEARNEADYNVSRDLRRSDVLDLLEVAETAFRDWETVRRSLQADAFLAALLAVRGMCR